MSTVCYCGNVDCGAPPNNPGACLASARKQRDELLAALKAAELLLSCGDFRNGVLMALLYDGSDWGVLDVEAKKFACICPTEAAALAALRLLSLSPAEKPETWTLQSTERDGEP